MKWKNIGEMRKAVTDKQQNNIETTFQVVSVTEQINMFCVTKWERLWLCREGEQANVKFCGFHTALDIEKENTVTGFQELPDHNTQNAFFFVLIKSSLCKGTDSGKRKIENES